MLTWYSVFMDRGRKMMMVAVTLYLLPLSVRAQDGSDNARLTNPLGDQTLVGLLMTILDGVIMLLIPIIVLMVIYSGFLFVTAQGNQEKLSRAKMTLGWTLVGALIILGAHAILNIVTGTVESLAE